VQLPQLRRIRWAVRAALILGVAASVAANVLHAQPNPISQTISAWPPLALLLTIELTSRIPMHKPLLAAVRVMATVTIAGIAAWVSYWHMQGVAVRFGETETSAYLLPISVDGLIVVASVSLVELAGRIWLLEDKLSKAALAAAAVPAVAPVQFVPPVQPVAAPATAPACQPAATPEPVPAAPTGWSSQSPALSDDDPRSSSSALSAAPVSPAVVATKPVSPYVNGSTPPARPSVARAAVSAPARTIVTAPTMSATDPLAPRQRRPIQETAELAAEIERMHPEISQTELAKQLGISPTRLRAVRREARELRRATALRR
jgi:hypothetical protein